SGGLGVCSAKGCDVIEKSVSKSTKFRGGYHSTEPLLLNPPLPLKQTLPRSQLLHTWRCKIGGGGDDDLSEPTSPPPLDRLLLIFECALPIRMPAALTHQLHSGGGGTEEEVQVKSSFRSPIRCSW